MSNSSIALNITPLTNFNGGSIMQSKVERRGNIITAMGFGLHRGGNMSAPLYNRELLDLDNALTSCGLTMNVGNQGRNATKNNITSYKDLLIWDNGIIVLQKLVAEVFEDLKQSGYSGFYVWEYKQLEKALGSGDKLILIKALENVKMNARQVKGLF